MRRSCLKGSRLIDGYDNSSMYPESDLLPISGLQHLLFCERQCALIHLEREWEENRWTAEGRVLHKKAHDGKPETRDGERLTRGLPLRSLELGLFGVADIVLWRPPSTFQTKLRTLRQAIVHSSVEELADWEITPVEYKRGKPKRNDCDRAQLCAQAMCLEEMLGVTVGIGQLYYGAKRRRFDVALDRQLRDLTTKTVARFRAIMESGVTPPAEFGKKCDTCSLRAVCLPTIAPQPSTGNYMIQQVRLATSDR